MRLRNGQTIRNNLRRLSRRLHRRARRFSKACGLHAWNRVWFWVNDRHGSGGLDWDSRGDRTKVGRGRSPRVSRGNDDRLSCRVNKRDGSRGRRRRLGRKGIEEKRRGLARWVIPWAMAAMVIGYWLLGLMEPSTVEVWEAWREGTDTVGHGKPFKACATGPGRALTQYTGNYTPGHCVHWRSLILGRYSWCDRVGIGRCASAVGPRRRHRCAVGGVGSRYTIAVRLGRVVGRRLLHRPGCTVGGVRCQVRRVSWDEPAPGRNNTAGHGMFLKVGTNY